jgi:hypothetical protein
VINYYCDLDILCALANLNGKNAFVGLGWENISNIDKVELLSQNIDKISIASKDPLKKQSQQIKEPIKFFYNSSIRNWRYDKHPDYQYSFVKIDNDNFAVTKLFTDPLTRCKYGDVVDFECKTNNYKDLEKIFSKTIKKLQNQNVDSITTWALPHTELFNVLMRMGLNSVKQERYLCLKFISKGSTKLKKLSNWHLVQADTEIF